MTSSRFAGADIGIPNETLIAATPEDMRVILDDLTSSAIRGKISPEVFGHGIFELEQAGVSPNYIGRNIRNTLKNPLARMLVDNPDVAESMAHKSIGMLDQFGVNPDEMRGFIGPGMDLLRQAKQDGLLRPDVTDEEVARDIQKPLYTAIQGYAKDNRDNPQVNELLQRGFPGMTSHDKTNLEIFFSPEKFGY